MDETIIVNLFLFLTLFSLFRAFLINQHHSVTSVLIINLI